MTPWIFDTLLAPLPDMIQAGRPTFPVLVRSIGAFIVAFFFVFFLGRQTAAFLYRHGVRDRVREYDEVFGKNKSGTPTMGGILIVGATATAALVFCDLRSPIACLLLLTTLWFGAIGALDDSLKVKNQSSDGGLSRTAKMLLQLLFASFVALVVLSEGSSPFDEAFRTRLFLPFPGPKAVAPLDLGWLYAPFIVFAIIAIANAINFADGLDGLAVLPCGVTAAVFGFFAYLMWNSVAANAFGFVSIPGMQDVAIYSSAVVGACFGFLWFNGYPAQIFMGDTGSMALGGSLGAIAVLSKQEVLFLIAGGLFVFEAFSVLFQDYVGIRWIGRRFFFRAPAHHSYQYRGVAETKVVVRFWIMSLLFAVLSVSTLKLR